MKRLHQYDQHFIRSPKIVAELIGHTSLNKRDLVYEFGAGSGVITSVLAGRVAEVVAIENEPNTLDVLRDNMKKLDNVTVVNADAMKANLPRSSYKVFANPPFSIISQLVRRLVESKSPPTEIYLIVQKQFARKITPSDQHFTSAFGIELAPQYQVRIRLPLRKSDFTPPPAVDTVLIEMKLREKPLLPADQLADFREFVRTCFADYAVYFRIIKKIAPDFVAKKPSELSPEQWIDLYGKL